MERSSDAPGFLRELIAIPSLSGNEGAVADFLFEFLSRRGAAPDRIGDSLWFEKKGDAPGRTLLLAAHIDTVAAGSGWSVDPFAAVERAGRIYGRGAGDDKASVAAFVLCGLNHQPLAGRLVVALTSGEETGDSGLPAVLEEVGPVDGAVIGEPTGLDICIRQKGLLVLSAVARGIAGHAGRPDGTVNAIEEAAIDISALRGLVLGPEDPYLGTAHAAATIIRGGNAHNVIPESCEFTIDVRTVPGRSHEEITTLLRETLASELTPRSGRYRPCATDESDPVVVNARAAHPEGILTGSPTASDWAFIDCPAVKMGPGDSALSHRPDESIEADELVRAVNVFERLVSLYCGG